MNRKEELITRWIDGELNEETLGEFEALMAEDPAFCSQVREEADGIRSAMRSEISAEIEPPYPDFFNNQIQKRIRQESDVAAPARATGGASVLWWLRSPLTWGAAALFMLMLLTRNGDREGEGGSYVVSTYAPDPRVSVERAEYDDDAQATVIMLTGLERIPDEVEVRGRDITAYEPAGSRGGGLFYAGQAQVAYVIERSPDGVPEILVR